MMDCIINLTSSRNEAGKVIVDERFSCPGQLVGRTKEGHLIIEFANCAIEHPVAYFGLRSQRLNNSITCNVMMDGKKYPLTKCTPQAENGMFTKLSEMLNKVETDERRKNPAYDITQHIYRKTFTIAGCTIDAQSPLNRQKYDVDITVILGKKYHFIEQVRVYLPEQILIGFMPQEDEAEEDEDLPPSPTHPSNVVDTPASDGTGVLANTEGNQEADNDAEEDDDKDAETT
jgi:hypothetical protein